MNKQNLTYLFEFDFQKGSINSNVIDWCKEHGIDFFYDKYQKLFANVYGGTTYYKIVIVDVVEAIKEVYINTAVSITGNWFDITDEKAFSTVYPVRKVKCTLRDGSITTVEVLLPSVSIEEYLERITFESKNNGYQPVETYQIVG